MKNDYFPENSHFLQFFLAFFDTKSCLDPTYHMSVRSVSIDGRLDTHEGGVQ